MTPPAGLNRLPAHPDETQRHGPDTRVWVHHGGAWRPGVVVAAAGSAVTVRYRYSSTGTGVDTVRWPDIAAEERTEPDTYVG